MHFLDSFLIAAHSFVIHKTGWVFNMNDGKEQTMRKRLMVVVAAAMIGCGTGVVLAGYGPGARPDGPPGMASDPRGPENRMAKILNLSETQQTRIKAILDSERELTKPLFDKMHELRKQLMQAAEAATFDEAVVRAAAEEQAKIDIELTVSRTRTQSRINALLTPEQRDLQKRLRPDMKHE